MTIIPRNEHTISRKNISDNALKVLYRLNKAGYSAYLVGGGVRDLLLGTKPKDFDIATNATPDQIRRLFRNCRLVGRRFRLAHIMFGTEIIEVATFRGTHSNSDNNKNTAHQAKTGMLLRDNVYGSIEEDAWRRDFTINSLYYSIADYSLRDYTCGLQDLQQKIIRMIGDPETRYREDPVRMLRAVRFSAKLNMTIDPATSEPIFRLAPLLSSISPARLFEEALKMLQSGNGYHIYQQMCQYQIFQPLFPLLAQNFTAEHDSNMERMIIQVLRNTDHRIQTNKRVNPAFLFAAMLWYPLIEHAQKLSQESGLSYYDSFALAMNDILDQQCYTLSIPKRITATMRDIWQLQLRLPYREGKKAYRLLEHIKFRAGYDLLELRSEIENGEFANLVNWWEVFQTANEAQQKEMIQQVNKTTAVSRHRRAHQVAKTNFVHKKQKNKL